MIRILDIFQRLKNERHHHMVKDVDLLDEAFYQNYFKYYPEFLAKKSVLFFEKSNCYGVFDYKSVKRVLQDKEFFSSENFKNDDKILLGADGAEHLTAKKAVTKNIDFLKENKPDGTESQINHLVDKLIKNLPEEKDINVIEWIVNPFVLNLILDKYGMLPQYPSLDLFSDESTHERKIGDIQKIFIDRGLLGDISRESFQQKKMSPDLLKLLSELSESGFQEEDLIKFSNVFLQAGVLTTASLLGSCILNMDRLYEKEILDDKYLDSFVNEVLRLYSPSQFVFRRVVKKVQMDGVEIPEGALMAVSIGAANRDEQHFEAALEFNLNRTEKHIAFGISAHKCIGERMAMAIAKAFVRKFYFEYYKPNNLTFDNGLSYDNSILIYKIDKLILKQKTTM